MKDTIQDFINPKASITIGSMSAIVITITTVLNQDFNLNIAYVALCLSLFLAALETYNSKGIKGWKAKFCYTLLTGLIIFSTARGGNITLSKVEERLASLPSTQNVCYASIIPICGQTTDVPTTNEPPKPIFKPW